ncbi:hypothetical protein YSY43_22110 [Paenibacillus sp. YSY-4.3]
MSGDMAGKRNKLRHSICAEAAEEVQRLYMGVIDRDEAVLQQTVVCKAGKSFLISN